MKHPLLATLGVALLTGASFGQGSDACSGAQSIAGCGTFAFDTSAASQDGLPSPACFKFGTSQVDNDVWFSWVAPASGTVDIVTCGLASVDTKLAVYSDTGACPPTAILDCNDDTCGLQSSVSFSAAAGSPYLIRVGSFPGALGGTGQIDIDGCGPTTIGTNYCTSTVNSTGVAATISGAGSGSISADDLVLTATDVPQTPGIGIFIASKTGMQMLPFFDGFLCLAPPVIRINTFTPPVGGVVTQAIDLGSAPISAMAGDDVWFQHWFRDPAAGGTGANFTDGLEILGLLP